MQDHQLCFCAVAESLGKLQTHCPVIRPLGVKTPDKYPPGEDLLDKSVTTSYVYSNSLLTKTELI